MATFGQCIEAYAQNPAIAILNIRRLILRNQIPPQTLAEAALALQGRHPLTAVSNSAGSRDVSPVVAQAAIAIGARPSSFAAGPVTSPLAPLAIDVAAVLVGTQTSDPALVCGARLAAESEAILRANRLEPAWVALVIAEGPPLFFGSRSQLELAYQLGSPLVGPVVTACAALALPANRIEILLGVAVDPIDEARKAFARLSAQAAQLGGKREGLALWLEALDAAEATPERRDDVLAVSNLVMTIASVASTGLETGDVEALSRATAVLKALGTHRDLVPTLVPIVTLALLVAASFGEATSKSERTLASLGEALVPHAGAGTRAGSALAIQAARSLARRGEPGRAETLLRAVDAAAEDDLVRLEVAKAWLDAGFGKNAFGRVDALAKLLLRVSANSLDDDARARAVQTLIASWPVGRPGVDPWVKELEQIAARLAEPTKSSHLLSAAMAWFNHGNKASARAAVARVDADTLRRFGGPGRSTLERILVSAQDELAMLRDGDASASDGWLGLAANRRFAEAAKLAQEESEQLRAAGFAHIADGQLAAAGKLHYLAGDPKKALTCLEPALAEMERVANDVTQVGTLAYWYSDWAQRFAYAAFAALDVRDAKRALAFADRARFRLQRERIGPRPSGQASAQADLWRRYQRAWRVAAAGGANEVMGETFVRDEKTQADVVALRDELLAGGATRAELIPLGAPVDVDEIVDRLGRHAKGMAVLYAIRANDRVRFLGIDGSGVRELAPKGDVRTALGKCEAYIEGLKTATDRSGFVQEELPALIDAIGAVLHSVASEALRSSGANRLLWIPHGPLAVVPLGACRGDDGTTVLDLAPVLVAPSLSDARDALEAPRTVTRRVHAARGRPEGSVDPSGSDRLLRALDPACPPEFAPRDAASLVNAVREGGVLQLSAHGIFVPADPLATYIALETDAPLTSFFDAPAFERPLLAILASCDSATVSQLDANDAIGLPVALRALGATAVLGAMWPVASTAAFAILAKFYQSLEKGIDSAEALRTASLWLRDATSGEVIDLLEAVGHPTPATAHAIPRDRKLFASPVRWGAFVHWGAATRVV